MQQFANLKSPKTIQRTQNCYPSSSPSLDKHRQSSALVWKILLCVRPVIWFFLNPGFSVIADYRSHPNPKNYWCVQLLERRWLVFQRLFACNDLRAADVWPSIHFLLREVDLYYSSTALQASFYHICKYNQ